MKVSLEENIHTQFYLFAFQLVVKESKNAAGIMTPKDSKFSEVLENEHCAFFMLCP